MRTPSFTWSVVLLLALGVGSVTTIFTLVDHVLLRPLPYPMADRLVYMRNGSHSGPVFEDFQKFSSVEAWAAATTRDANLTGAGRPQRLREAQISREFFPVFAARPSFGRLLVAEDFRTGEGVVLTYGTWQSVFGGEDDVIGRSIVLDGKPAVVVGVLDASFTQPEALVGSDIDVWRPIDPAAGWLKSRNSWMLSVAGRFREGSSLAAVEREAEALAEQRARDFPDNYTDEKGNAAPLAVVSLQNATVGQVRLGLGVLFGAVALLLLVACANVALLFMARGLARMREMAVRRALGAGTASVTMQLLIESLLLAGGGAALGVLLAIGGLRGILALIPEALPRSAAATIDLRVLAFAITTAAATAMIFGLLPALRLAGRDVLGALQSRGRGNSEGRGAHRVRAALIIAEVALSLVLVTQAGALLRSFAFLHSQELGFRTENIWTMPLTPAGIETPEEWVRRMEAVRASLAATPGVSAATYGISMPLEFTGGGRCCWRTSPEFPGTGRGGANVSPVAGDVATDAMIHPVDADFFQLLDLRLVAGSFWTRHEQETRPAPVVLSEPLAIEVFGSAQEALGHEMRMDENVFRVTGVLADNRYYGPDGLHGPAVYIPITAATFPGRAHMAVQVDGPREGLANQLREAIWSAEPDLPVPVVRALDDWAGAAAGRMRFESMMFTMFGTVALLLVAGGLYGTLLYTVGSRRRELGIRLALGDAPGRLEGRVLWQGLRTAAVGCVLGVAGAWGFGKLLESRLFGVQAGDLVSTGGALAILLIVALLASWLPARRAAATDPMEALRAE
jgi:predicted permease